VGVIALTREAILVCVFGDLSSGYPVTQCPVSAGAARASALAAGWSLPVRRGSSVQCGQPTSGGNGGVRDSSQPLTPKRHPPVPGLVGVGVTCSVTLGLLVGVVLALVGRVSRLPASLPAQLAFQIL